MVHFCGLRLQKEIANIIKYVAIVNHLFFCAVIDRSQGDVSAPVDVATWRLYCCPSVDYGLKSIFSLTLSADVHLRTI